MKKSLALILSAAVLTVSLLFAACDRQPQEPEKPHNIAQQEKSTSAKPVKIVEVPSEKSSIVEMFNAAVDYVDVYCYGYTKAVKCEVNSLSVGALSAASSSADAFKSIFGETEVTTKYDYNADKELFRSNFPAGNLDTAQVTDAAAREEDGDIILTLTFPDERNAAADGNLAALTNTYASVDSVNDALTQFSSSANSVSVISSGIKAVAVISAEDSSLKRMEISYDQRFVLSGVKLVKLEESSVSGSSGTTVVFTEIG